ADEVVDRPPPAIGVPLEKAAQSVVQRADDIRPDRVIEHGGGADLYGPAAEKEIAQCMLERGDAADSRETLVRKSLCELRHLRKRERENRRPTEAAGRHETVDVNLEFERFGVDERQRRERVR